MNNDIKIFLDLDGVIVDFVGGACKAHDLPSPYELKKHYGNWDIQACWYETHGKPAEEDFYNKFRSVDFWSNLNWLPDGKEIFDTLVSLFGVDNICILSSPGKITEALPGKINWINNHIPQFANRFILGTQKHFMAHQNSILIDDHDGNIDLFTENGGKTIHVPRLWNRLHHLSNKTNDHVKSELIKLFNNKPINQKDKA